MKSTIKNVAWFFLALALCAWAGIAFLFLTIQSKKNSHVRLAATEQVKYAKDASSVRLHDALVKSTESRERLKSITSADVVAIVDAIESTGKAAGVDAQVSNALTEGGGKASAVSGYSFIVQGRGTFSSLMHVVALLQNLPWASSLDDLNLEKDPGNPDWSMSARVRVVLANPSS